jgi:aflatoxin B1 aldehyde reductase
VHDLKDAAAMLDVFQKYGHKEVDTARVYGGGSSDEYLGKLNWQERGLVMETNYILGVYTHRKSRTTQLTFENTCSNHRKP